MLSVVTWFWRSGESARQYRSEHVDALALMFRRRLSVPHRFICIADDGESFGSNVEHFVTPAAARAMAKIKTPEQTTRFPSCYRRMWIFSKEARALGEQVLLIDIDLLVTADPAPLVDSSADFVGWRPRMRWGNQQRVGGGIYLLRTGSRTPVWDSFSADPQRCIARARAAGFRGSDQAWMSYCLGAGEAYWPPDAGIYSIRDLSTDPRQTNGGKGLPPDARIVQFNGPVKPWMSATDWVRKHWPKTETNEPVRC